MGNRLIFEKLVVHESINSPHFMNRAVPLSLSVQPASCPSADVLGIGCENVNCVQVVESVE